MEFNLKGVVTLKKMIFGIILKIKSIIRSLKNAHDVHLGDDVLYDGKLCFVNNGISYPIWDLCEKRIKKDGTRNTYRVHENNFEKVRSLHNLKNGIVSLHRWYMNNWYNIDLRKMTEGND